MATRPPQHTAARITYKSAIPPRKPEGRGLTAHAGYAEADRAPTPSDLCTRSHKAASTCAGDEAKLTPSPLTGLVTLNPSTSYQLAPHIQF